MSFSTNESSKQNTTGRLNESFHDSHGGVESTGQGRGSGAFDSGDSVPGGYPSKPQQRVSADQTFRTGDNFDESPQVGQTQSQKPSQRAFGDSRAAEKPGFSGSDSKYDTTETGGAFSRPSQTGLSQRDELDDTPTSTSIPGTRTSDATSGGKYGDRKDDVPSSVPGTRASGGVTSVGKHGTPTDDVTTGSRPSGATSGGKYDDKKGDVPTSVPGTRPPGATSGGKYDTPTDDVRKRDPFPGPTGARSGNDQFGSEVHKEHAGKPSFGDKLRGNAEKLAGTVTGKPELKERGQERKTGDY